MVRSNCRKASRFRPATVVGTSFNILIYKIIIKNTTVLLFKNNFTRRRAVTDREILLDEDGWVAVSYAETV